MLTNRPRGPWPETVVLAIVTALLYHLGIGFLVFLVPLQVLQVRRGTRYFLAAGGLVLASIAVIRLITGQEHIMAVELLGLAALMGGLAAVDELRIPGLRRVYLLLMATALAGLLSVPLILYLKASEGFTSAFRETFAAAAEMLKGSVEVPMSADQLMGLAGAMLMRSYLFDYFLMLTGIWWAGSVLGARSLGRPPGITRLADFQLPDTAVWPLILGLALVLLDIFRGAGVAGAIGWNLALIFLFLYGLCGVGVLRHLLQRFRMARSLRLLVGIGLIVLLFSPRAGLVAWSTILLLLSGLGVSETWIKYRRMGRSENPS